MMKKLVLLFAILFTTYSFACSCARFGTPFHRFSPSDLVADVTFTKVYPDLKNKNSPYINVDLKYNEIFKGKSIKTMKVYGAIFEGNKRYGSFTSCSLGAKVGQRMIVFLKKDKDGVFALHYCDHKIYEKSLVSGIGFSDSKNILRKLKSNGLFINSKYSSVDFGFDQETGKDDLDNVKGLNTKNRFAIFEITLNIDGSFKDVSTIQSFDSDKDDDILSIIKNGKVWIAPDSKILEDEKFNLILFFYPKEKSNLSFVSQHFLN